MSLLACLVVLFQKELTFLIILLSAKFLFIPFIFFSVILVLKCSVKYRHGIFFFMYSCTPIISVQNVFQFMQDNNFGRNFRHVVFLHQVMATLLLRRENWRNMYTLIMMTMLILYLCLNRLLLYPLLSQILSLYKQCGFCFQSHMHFIFQLFYDKFVLLQETRPGSSNQSGLRFISGIVCKSKVLRFERMLFRATRGNMLFNQAPADEQIMDPISTEMVFFFLIILSVLISVMSLPWFFFNLCCYQLVGTQIGLDLFLCFYQHDLFYLIFHRCIFYFL